MTNYFQIVQPDNSTALMTTSEMIDYAKKILRNNHSIGQYENVKMSDVSTSFGAMHFLSIVGFAKPTGRQLYNPDRIDSYITGEEIDMPIGVAWDMRAKYAYPSDMTPKRPDEMMTRLTDGIAHGNFEPIPVTRSELKKGILTEGKHRLIVAKRLRMRRVPIIIEGE